MIWHQVKGATQWILCLAVRGRRVGRTVALKQLDSCRTCPGAQCHDALGILYLSCGPPGVDRELEMDPTCGCVLGWVSVLRRRRLKPVGKAPVLAAMLPAGKTRCATCCPRGRW